MNLKTGEIGDGKQQHHQDSAEQQDTDQAIASGSHPSQVRPLLPRALVRFKRGLSIIEVICGFTVFALTAAALANLLVSSAIATRSTEQQYQAGQLAQSVLYQLQSVPFNTLADGTSPWRNVNREGLQLLYRVQISPALPYARATTAVLTATVRWEQGGRAQLIQRQVWVSRALR